VPLATDFDMRKSGLPPGGVVVLPQSLAAGSPFAWLDEHAVLSIAGGFAGNVAASLTANVWLTEVPAARVPSCRMQVEPALLLGLQLQPEEELPGRKVERDGTVSVSWTPAASWLPRLATMRL
jgi:hypothetical protein